jgi:hypothetical protein
MSPAATTVVVAGATLLAYAALFTIEDTFHLGRWFGAWAAVVAASLVAWLALFADGIRRLGSPATERWRRPRAWWRRQTLLYAATALITSVLMASITVDAHVPAAERIRPFVLVTGVVAWLAAYPWVVTVWLAHEEVSAVGDDLATIDPAGTGAVTQVAHVVAALERTWSTIERSSLALAAILTTMVLDVVTLRAGWLRSGAVTEAELPSAVALGYGAFFAAVGAAIVVPLVLAWRTRALALAAVVVPLPTSTVPSEADLAARARFELRLGLQSHTLRNPITLLSVFAPILTAALSGLVPT